MKHLIVLVGLPGSGKSTVCKKYSSYTRISQDDMGKEGHLKTFKNSLSKGEDIIVDRCNFNVDQRQRYIQLARIEDYKITIMWLKVTAEECKKRIRSREMHPNLDKNSDSIDKVVDMFDNMFVAPSAWEADEVLFL